MKTEKVWCITYKLGNKIGVWGYGRGVAWFKTKALAKKRAELELKRPFPDFKAYKLKQYPKDAGSAPPVLGNWFLEHGRIIWASNPWQGD